MIYGYVRYGRNQHLSQQQRDRILSFAQSRDLKLETWLEIRTSRSENKTDALKSGDGLIVSKLFWLGRDGTKVLSLLKSLLDRGVVIHSAEEGLTLGGDEQSGQLSAAFDLVLRIFSENRSQRSKESLEELKAKGRKLGRPFGSVNKVHKLDSKMPQLQHLLKEKLPTAQIARQLNVDAGTLRRYQRSHPELISGGTDA